MSKELTGVDLSTTLVVSETAPKSKLDLIGKVNSIQENFINTALITGFIRIMPSP
jgi:hypothetical protein